LVAQKYAKSEKYAKPKCQPPPKYAKFQKFGIKICQLATLISNRFYLRLKGACSLAGRALSNTGE